MEIGFRVPERGAAQGKKAIDIPPQQYIFARIEIYREVEEVRHVWNRLAIPRRAAGLQHVEAFDDENVWAINLDPLVGHNVIDQMRVDRCARRSPPRLD